MRETGRGFASPLVKTVLVVIRVYPISQTGAAAPHAFACLSPSRLFRRPFSVPHIGSAHAATAASVVAAAEIAAAAAVAAAAVAAAAAVVVAVAKIPGRCSRT